MIAKKRFENNEMKYISEVLTSGFNGKFIEYFEKAFAQKMKTRYAISINSGTSALHCALVALGIEKGDEVIIPALTFSAPAIAILQVGAKPIFVDVKEDTFLINEDEIENKITNKTKVILPVHLYGSPANMKSIIEIADRNELAILEDSAECILGKSNNKIAGTIGDVGIFSFQSTKHMTSGEGGMIVTNDKTIATKARMYSNLGYSSSFNKTDLSNPKYKRHHILSHNYRMSELCAAMLLGQLEVIDDLISSRRKIASIYDEIFTKQKSFIPQKIVENSISSYWCYTIKLSMDINQELLDKFLISLGNKKFKRAWRLAYQEPFFKKYLHSSLDICPIAERIQPRLIQLKTNSLTSNEINTIKEIINYLEKGC